MATSPEIVANAVVEYRNRYGLTHHEPIGPCDFPAPPDLAEGFELPGCYAHYHSEPPSLLYIGKTRRPLKERCKEWTRDAQREGKERFAYKVQCFPVSNWWEAASLEEFLISRFRPLNNDPPRTPWPDA